jgi:hypothetical protein
MRDEQAQPRRLPLRLGIPRLGRKGAGEKGRARARAWGVGARLLRFEVGIPHPTGGGMHCGYQKTPREARRGKLWKHP